MNSNHPVDVLKRKIDQAHPAYLSKIRLVLGWIVDSDPDALMQSIKALNRDKNELIKKLSKCCKK